MPWADSEAAAQTFFRERRKGLSEQAPGLPPHASSRRAPRSPAREQRACSRPEHGISCIQSSHERDVDSPTFARIQRRSIVPPALMSSSELGELLRLLGAFPTRARLLPAPSDGLD